MDFGTLFAGFVFSVVGLSLFVYGKRQTLPVPILGGIVLMTLPVLLPDPIAMSIVGTGITAGAYGFRHTLG